VARTGELLRTSERALLVAAVVVATAGASTVLLRVTDGDEVVAAPASLAADGGTEAPGERRVAPAPPAPPDGPASDPEPAPAGDAVASSDPAPEPVEAAVEEPLRRDGDVPGRTADSPMPLLDLDALAATAGRTGIPERALAAYASAALLLREEQPSCRLTWVTLAGIGYVESHHGTIGGRSLGADGLPSTPIVGVPLDGGPNVRAISDTDGGRYDGDDTWDRAVGPMQFIPSTWQRWGADGSGDGSADPQHVDDAALAAARYLCASGGDLTASSSWGQAMFSYNRSEDYVRHVLDVANRYAERANAG
jgi:hypothetical protein